MKLWLLGEPAPSWQGPGLTPSIAELPVLMGAAASWLALPSASSHRRLVFFVLLSLGCCAAGGTADCASAGPAASGWLSPVSRLPGPGARAGSRLSLPVCTQRCPNSSLSCRQEMREPCFRPFRKSSRVIMAHYLMARVYLGFFFFTISLRY